MMACMASQLPTFSDLKGRLAGMTHAEVQKLATQSGVPFMTLWNIRAGNTKNPRLETLRKFWPLINRRSKERAE
jgi:predicted transcriptional regulator